MSAAVQDGVPKDTSTASLEGVTASLEGTSIGTRGVVADNVVLADGEGARAGDLPLQTVAGLANEKPQDHAIDPELRAESTAEEACSSTAVTGDQSALLNDMREALKVQGVDVSAIKDATLMRFLRARSMNVSKAAKLLAAHESWRASFVPEGYMPEEKVATEIAAEKSYVQGYDKHGRPLIYVAVKKHDAYKRDMEEFKRMIVYGMDKLAAAAEANGCEKFVGVLELKGIGYRCLDSGGLRHIFDFMQGYYPERLGMLWFLNAPTIFWAVWKVVSPFIDKVTRSKIAFVDDKSIDQIRSQFEKDQLPEALGGSLPLVPLHLAKVQGWPPKSAAA